MASAYRIIAEEAAELGFACWGVARPVLPAAEQARIRTWLAHKRHAGMRWMARPERVARLLAPASLMPRARAMLVLALPHPPPPYTLAEALVARTCAQIAAYAQGRDYHDIIKRKLKALARRLLHAGATQDARVYVDTAPVAENFLAEQAGIGWRGKHTLTISRQWGSWLLLGEVLLDAELAPSLPASRHCGTCRRCLDVCPTGAIVAPGVVDARRCLSYWTIEHKGFLPRWIRMRLGNRVFGCDDCQLVCPWNRKARTVSRAQSALGAREDLVLPPLVELLALDETGFRARFAKTPVRRLGYERFLRNIATAAAHAADPALIQPLIQRILHPAPLVRTHAGWALARLAQTLGGRSARLAREALANAYKREPDARVRKDLAASLAMRLDGPAPSPQVLQETT